MSRSVFADFTCHLDPGVTLYSVGDPGTTMFVVQSGAVELVRETTAGASVIAVMEKGDFFGEMSLLEGVPRSSTARSVDVTDVIEISPALFDRMIRNNIEIAVRMLRKLSIRLSEVSARLEKPQPPAVGATRDEAAVPGQNAASATPAAPAPTRAVRARRGEPSTDSARHRSPPRATPPAGNPTDVGFRGVLVHLDGDEVFSLGSGTARVGRFDPVTGTRPEVDLTLLDLKRSVSRRHAVLTVDDSGCLLTEEVGALNGTSVNGQDLTSGEAVSVKDGDEIAFGSVNLRFQTTAP